VEEIFQFSLPAPHGTEPGLPQANKTNFECDTTKRNRILWKNGHL